MGDDSPRLLSIQSHVVSGYVGNKSATFPLQLLGFEVDAINSVQFSNHTGYEGGVKGQVLNDSELADLMAGLRINKIDRYAYMLTGYIGSRSFLVRLAEVVKQLKASNPGLKYVCDPVMGDTGPGLYVPKELLPVYQETILPLADICLPNQFEAELLTGKTIKSESDALEVMDLLHEKGVATVVLSSTEFGGPTYLVGLASSRQAGRRQVVRVRVPRLAASFVGTGDLFTALLTAWLHRTDGCLKAALEKTFGTMQAVLKRTLAHAQSAAGSTSSRPTPSQMELKLIQSKLDIENPPETISGEVIVDETY